MTQTAGLIALVGLLAASHTAAQAPTAWRGGPGWEVGADREIRHSGRASGYIAVTDLNTSGGFGTLRQSFLTDEFRGKRVKFSAWVKTGAVQDGTALWMRVDGDFAQVLAFDNMSNRAIPSDTDWRQYHIVLDVPEKSTSMILGLMVRGKGRAWIDDVEVETVGADVMTTGLTAQELAELAEHAADHGHTPEEEAKARQEAAERLRTLPKRPLNLDFES